MQLALSVRIPHRFGLPAQRRRGVLDLNVTASRVLVASNLTIASRACSVNVGRKTIFLVSAMAKDESGQKIEPVELAFQVSPPSPPQQTRTKPHHRRESGGASWPGHRSRKCVG